MAVGTEAVGGPHHRDAGQPGTAREFQMTVPRPCTAWCEVRLPPLCRKAPEVGIPVIIAQLGRAVDDAPRVAQCTNRRRNINRDDRADRPGGGAVAGPFFLQWPAALLLRSRHRCRFGCRFRLAGG
ncbi:MAG: hypothetical protein D6725_00345 [Planctomycetota bacterium]|nr:MAG: hypothetical protein D6725_00345 [Planctomycetota bacterium]